METSAVGSWSIVFCVLDDADSVLADAVPLGAAAHVRIVGLEGRRASGDAVARAMAELTRRVRRRAVDTRSEIHQIARWADAVRVLAAEPADLVVLPWRQDPDLELLAGQIRRHTRLPLALVYPGEPRTARDEVWAATAATPRPWIP